MNDTERLSGTQKELGENPEDGMRRAADEMASRRALKNDGWREGRDGLWRNDRFGGSYKMSNALKRVGSKHGEESVRPGPFEPLPKHMLGGLWVDGRDHPGYKNVAVVDWQVKNVLDLPYMVVQDADLIVTDSGLVLKNRYGPAFQYDTELLLLARKWPYKLDLRERTNQEESMEEEVTADQEYGTILISGRIPLDCLRIKDAMAGAAERRDEHSKAGRRDIAREAALAYTALEEALWRLERSLKMEAALEKLNNLIDNPSMIEDNWGTSRQGNNPPPPPVTPRKKPNPSMSYRREGFLRRIHNRILGG